MNRDCKKCIYHTSGMCSKWECEMTTLEDYRNKAIDEFVKKVIEQLEKMKVKTDTIESRHHNTMLDICIDIVRKGGVNDD